VKKNISTNISLVFLLCAILVSACKSKKVISESSGIESYSATDIKYKIKAANVYFSTMEASGVAVINSPQLNISGNFVMRLNHDETAWMVVKKFGIEAARLLITNDSVTVLNRFEKSYYQMSVEEGLKMIGLEMGQNEIIEFLAGNAIIDKSEFISITQDTFTYEYKTAYDNMIATYSFNALTETTSKATFADMQNNSFECDYYDYRSIDDVQIIAFERLLTTSDTRIGDASIELKFKDISIDEELSFPFEIPTHYIKKN